MIRALGENENLSDLNFQCLLLLSHMPLSIDVNPETSHTNCKLHFEWAGREHVKVGRKIE